MYFSTTLNDDLDQELGSNLSTWSLTDLPFDHQTSNTGLQWIIKMDSKLVLTLSFNGIGHRTFTV